MCIHLKILMRYESCTFICICTYKNTHTYMHALKHLSPRFIIYISTFIIYYLETWHVHACTCMYITSIISRFNHLLSRCLLARARVCVCVCVFVCV